MSERTDNRLALAYGTKPPDAEIITELTNNTGGVQSNSLSAVPAGGTGAAAGGWDTAVNRDAAIENINDNFASLNNSVDRIIILLRNMGMNA